MSRSEWGRDGSIAAAAAVFAIAAVAYAALLAQGTKNAITAVMPDKIPWFTFPYYTDGRLRAQLFGDSGKSGPWIDRVKIPSGGRVLAHTHPEDELVTVIEGTWFVGEKGLELEHGMPGLSSDCVSSDAARSSGVKSWSQDGNDCQTFTRGAPFQFSTSA